MATTAPFDVAAQTKVMSDQFLALVSQAQNATLSTVKTMAGFVSPVVETLPAVPFAPSAGDVTKLVDVAFDSMSAVLASQRSFVTDLVGATVAAPKAAKASK